MRISTKIDYLNHTLNKYQEPFGNIQMGVRSTKKYGAFCESRSCCSTKKYYQREVLKNVSKNINICPDCNSGLLWKEIK